MDGNRQIHAKLLPLFKIWQTCVWKTIPFLSSRIRALISSLKKYPPFSRKWVRAWVYALIGSVVGWGVGGVGVGVLGGGGEVTTPYTKHMWKYHFQFFGLFFLYVAVVIVLMRFHGPYSLGSLYYSTLISVAITKNMNITNRNHNTAKHHRSQTVCISLEMHRTLYLQLVNVR